jgi:hypothetical protein
MNRPAIFRLACLLSFAAAATGCGKHGARLDEVFGSPSASDTVRHVDQIEAFRLAPASYYKASLAEYETVGKAVDVSGEDADRLVAILTDTGTYDFDIAKGCEPVYAVGVRFVAGDEAVTVLFCFECDILTVYEGDQVVGSGNFDAAHRNLAEIIKRIFPDDEGLRET